MAVEAIGFEDPEMILGHDGLHLVGKGGGDQGEKSYGKVGQFHRRKLFVLENIEEKGVVVIGHDKNDLRLFWPGLEDRAS